MAPLGAVFDGIGEDLFDALGIDLRFQERGRRGKNDLLRVRGLLHALDQAPRECNQVGRCAL